MTYSNLFGMKKNEFVALNWHECGSTPLPHVGCEDL